MNVSDILSPRTTQLPLSLLVIVDAGGSGATAQPSSLPELHAQFLGCLKKYFHSWSDGLI